MSLLIKPEKQYVLSLDSLDLNLLGKFFEKSDEKRMLWSKPFMDGESTYCMVNIVSEVSLTQDGYFEPSKTYTCHICNIDVPQVYYKEHKKSKMHNNCSKLTEKVLENLAKQIYVDVDSLVRDDLGKQFYCEICSKVVLVKHKREHYKSDYHLKCIEKQKVIDDFIEIYADGKMVDNIGNENNTEVFNDNTKKNDNDASNLDVEYSSVANADESSEISFRSNNEPAKNYSVFPINNVVPNTSQLLQSDELLLESDDSDDDIPMNTNQGITNFQIYIKEVVAKYNLEFKMPIIEDKSIFIVTPKGFKKRISLNSFHGFKVIENILFYCQLCRNGFYNLNYYDTHIREVNHVTNIIQPVNNDFSRDVINDNGRNQIHCLICNIMVAKESNHAALKHRKYIEANTPVTSTHHTSTPVKVPPKPSNTPTITYCDVCDRHIDTHNFTSHINGEKHKDKVKVKLVTPENNILVKDQYGTAMTFCDVCRKHIHTHNFVSHTKSNKHKEYLKTKIAKPSPVAVNNSKTSKNDNAQKSKTTFCAVCNRHIDSENFLDHIISKKHEGKMTANVKNATSALKLDNSVSEKNPVQNDEQFCRLCKVVVPKGGMTTHKAGKIHKRKWVTVGQTSNQNNTLNLPSTSKAIAVKETPPNDEKEKLFEYMKQMRIINEKELECLVCFVNVPNLYRNIAEHVEGSKHIKDMNNLLFISKINKTSWNMFYCVICKCNTKDFIDHINQDRNHQLKFLTLSKTQFEYHVYDYPLNSDFTASTYRQIHKVLLEKNNIGKLTPTCYYCNVCSMPMLRKNEINHMLCEQHIKSLKSRSS